MIKAAPSILSADFCRLGEEIDSALSCGADYIHFDVMDGSFVNNISFGIPVLESIRRSTGAFLDVHLMIDRPVRYVREFCRAGADLVNCHVESDSAERISEALGIIRDEGVKTGITLSPGTPADAVLPFISDVDLILVMTVVPGLGGQSFLTEQLETVRLVRKFINRCNPACELEVDGGINVQTAAMAVSAGANVLVAGSAFFGADDRAAFISALKGNA